MIFHPLLHPIRRQLASLVVLITLASLVATTLIVTGAADHASATTSTRTYEESSSDIRYSGSWSSFVADADSGVGSKYLNSTGSAQLTFTGTAVSWISRTSPSAGKNNVYLDGVKVATIDRYSSTNHYAVPVFTKAWTSSGTHTIELRWVGTKNSLSSSANLLLDALNVTSESSTTTAASTTTTISATGSGAAKLVLGGVSQKGVTLTWVKALTAPSRYEVKRSVDNTNFATIAQLSSSSTSYVDISAKPGVATSYRIAAIASSGATSSISASVAAMPKSVSTGTRYRYSTCPAATVTVSTSSALKSALYNAQAGTVIRLRPGTYLGTFSATHSGTYDKPIWVCGPRDAIITSGSYKSGHAFSIDSEHDIVLAGMTIRNSFKGVTVMNSQHITVTDLLVETIGYEAIHLRNQTTDSEVKYNTIRSTGLVAKEFGEGIYIGTSDSNWCAYNSCQPDRTNRTLILGNTISATGAQAIEAKAGSTDGVIAKNSLTGNSPGSAGAGWVLVKGNDWLVADNVGHNSPQAGYATNASVAGWGKNNIFVRNIASNVATYGLWIHLPNNIDLLNKVSCNNSTSSTPDGSTNVACKK